MRLYINNKGELSNRYSAGAKIAKLSEYHDFLKGDSRFLSAWRDVMQPWDKVEVAEGVYYLDEQLRLVKPYVVELSDAGANGSLIVYARSEKSAYNKVDKQLYRKNSKAGILSVREYRLSPI